MHSKAELTKLKKDQLIDLVIELEGKLAKVGRRPVVKTAPIAEKPKHGVMCHRVGCKETTDVRGFFCCGQHDDCKH